jgi:hypothetical protein
MSDEVRGAQMEIASRLRSAGIDIDDRTEPEALESLLDAVEAFEAAVQSQGGDLMVDEPPRGGTSEPDDPRFSLPQRTADDTVESYRERILAAANALNS